MPKYRKKPIVVEANQFYLNIWLEDNNAYPMVINRPISPMFERILLPTADGDIQLHDGDWIIKGLYGNYYICKPEEFVNTYDVVKETKKQYQFTFTYQMEVMGKECDVNLPLVFNAKDYEEACKIADSIVHEELKNFITPLSTIRFDHVLDVNI